VGVRFNREAGMSRRATRWTGWAAIAGIATLAAAALGGIALAADPPTAALVHHGGDRPGVTCAVAGSITGGPQLNTYDFTEVTNSQGYNLTCHFQYPVGTAPVETFEIVNGPLICGTPFGIATQTHFVATRSGRAMLSCQFSSGG
jgi:hypothetical protein